MMFRFILGLFIGKLEPIFISSILIGNYALVTYLPNCFDIYIHIYHPRPEG
jgi:hypothetical protein